jgi:hypothetical protein
MRSARPIASRPLWRNALRRSQRFSSWGGRGRDVTPVATRVAISRPLANVLSRKRHRRGDDGGDRVVVNTMDTVDPWDRRPIIERSDRLSESHFQSRRRLM